jgi:hypothetical protein
VPFIINSLVDPVVLIKGLHIGRRAVKLPIGNTITYDETPERIDNSLAVRICAGIDHLLVPFMNLQRKERGINTGVTLTCDIKNVT